MAGSVRTALMAALEPLRQPYGNAPDRGPWIREWGALNVRGITGDRVLSDQRNIDLAVAAVNALPDLFGALAPEPGPADPDSLWLVADLARRLLQTPADQELLFLDRLNDLSVAVGELDREVAR